MSGIIDLDEAANAICRAIRLGRVVRIRYGGSHGWRILEPHLIAVATNNEKLMWAWQRAGPSASSNVPGWRCFKVAQVDEVEDTGTPFAVRDDYQPDGWSLDYTILAVGSE